MYRNHHNLRIPLNGFRFAACVLQCIYDACIQPSPYNPFLCSSTPPSGLVRTKWSRTPPSLVHRAQTILSRLPYQHISRAIFGVALAL